MNEEMKKFIEQENTALQKVTPEMVEVEIVSEQYHQFEGTTLTVCCLTLQCGYNVTGEAACVDPATFDAEKGKQYAREDAVRKVWPLLGYHLMEKRAEFAVVVEMMGQGGVVVAADDEDNVGMTLDELMELNQGLEEDCPTGM